MPSFTLIAIYARSVAIATLTGATMLACPPTPARAETIAETAPDAVIQLAQAGTSRNRATRDATEAKGESVERRITNLRNALKITSDQEPKWNAVAQAMRENATNMDTLIAENRKTSPQTMTALDDLRGAQKVEQAHVDGLKNLLAPFETLYAAMPDAQKKIVDDVFRSPKRSPPSVYYGPYFPYIPFVRW
ncbi:MAG: Spy/CpxP family protein refolding chaperone [Candidatus Binatia bacterium]